MKNFEKCMLLNTHVMTSAYLSVHVILMKTRHLKLSIQFPEFFLLASPTPSLPVCPTSCQFLNCIWWPNVNCLIDVITIKFQMPQSQTEPCDLMYY